LLSIPTTLRLRKEHWKTCSFRLGTERTIVKIDDTRSQKEWNFPSCDGEKCKKGVVQKNGRFLCQVCKKAIDYPECFADSLAAADDESGLGYVDHAGLPLALANIIGTTHTLEMKSHTYYEHGTFESFTCRRIAPEEVVDVDSESSNMNTSAEVNITKVKRLVTKPFVTTHSKPTEEKEELKDSNDEFTGDMDDGMVDDKNSSLTDKRKKKRYIVDDCDSA
nr:hypothetical protein [Tanacetum cinerariifolium]